jgi:hypothetical protein
MRLLILQINIWKNLNIGKRKLNIQIGAFDTKADNACFSQVWQDWLLNNDQLIVWRRLDDPKPFPVLRSRKCCAIWWVRSTWRSVLDIPSQTTQSMCTQVYIFDFALHFWHLILDRLLLEAGEKVFLEEVALSPIYHQIYSSSMGGAYWRSILLLVVNYIATCISTQPLISHWKSCINDFNMLSFLKRQYFV